MRHNRDRKCTVCGGTGINPHHNAKAAETLSKHADLVYADQHRIEAGEMPLRVGNPSQRMFLLNSLWGHFGVSKCPACNGRGDYPTSKVGGMSKSAAQSILDKAYVSFADKFADGTELDERRQAIALADWNDPILARAGQKLNLQMEWEDEWTACDQCSGLIRTSPTSYGWTPEYHRFDSGDIVCESCLQEHKGADGIEDAIDDCAGDPKRAVPPFVTAADLEKAGWVKVGAYESGWHYGQDDDPKTCTKSLKALGFKPGDIVFRIDSNSQFTTDWSAWVRKSGVPALFRKNGRKNGKIATVINDDGDEVLDIITAKNLADQGWSNAGEMSNALSGKGPHPHIRAETRMLTKEEFVSGDWAK